jgi:8-hydroxy-5-deazaflavin:NADPH oxidoreductase
LGDSGAPSAPWRPNYIQALSERHGRKAGRRRQELRTDDPIEQAEEADMRIGIIGSGNIGATAARLFVDAGHEVAIANSRGPETLTELTQELGGDARAATAEEAASFGELLLVAIPFGRYRELPHPPAGTIVIDANNYYPGRDGNFPELDDDSTTSSELLAAHLPEARVVKAFNTMVWSVLRDRGNPDAGDARLVLFVAGDDAEAKAKVSGLIEEIGFVPVDTGSLAQGGRRQQPGSSVYTELITEREAEGALALADR